jgi:hypothetical protein
MMIVQQIVMKTPWELVVLKKMLMNVECVLVRVHLVAKMEKLIMITLVILGNVGVVNGMR